ncbi:MAG: hypothetical protein ACRC9P_04790 [Bacteroides sp.]
MGNKVYGKGWRDGKKVGTKIGRGQGTIFGILITAITGGTGAAILHRKRKTENKRRKELRAKRVINSILLLLIITIAAIIIYLYI